MTINKINLSKMKMSLAPLTGVDVYLRLLRLDDLPITLTWRNREDIRHHFIKSNILSWEQHLAWWEQYCTRNNDFVFIIEETNKLKRPVGQVSLYNIDLENDEAEYGRLMIGDNEARGRGLAVVVTELLTTWAFDILGLTQIYLRVLIKNAAAINLWRRCGFVACRNSGEVCLMSISRKAGLCSLKV
jgi:diamine N-acetyltransferase